MSTNISITNVINGAVREALKPFIRPSVRVRARVWPTNDRSPITAAERVKVGRLVDVFGISRTAKLLGVSGKTVLRILARRSGMRWTDFVVRTALARF